MVRLRIHNFERSRNEACALIAFERSMVGEGLNKVDMVEGDMTMR